MKSKIKHPVSIFLASVTNDHKLYGLKQKKFIFSQVWSLEAQDTGISRITFLPKFLGKTLPAFQLLEVLALPLACGNIPPSSASLFV